MMSSHSGGRAELFGSVPRLQGRHFSTKSVATDLSIGATRAAS